jgi:hypothetical protein
MKPGYRKPQPITRERVLDWALDTPIGGAMVALLIALVLGVFVLYFLEIGA